jgi:membrane-anchored protein YejM (alkaline phosphatase superfamily)
MNLSQHNQFSSKASQLLSWGHWFTFANIGLALCISLSYLFADSPPTSFIGITYMLVTWLSHTSFIAFLAFVLTVFPLSLVFPYPRHIRGMAALIATVGMSLLTLDAYVYFNLGYHLSSSALPEIISLLWHRLTSSPALTTLLAGGIVLLILSFQLTVSNFTWQHLARLKQFKFARFATSFLILCFALSHSIHIWADANLKFDVTKQDNVLPLSYPTTAKSLLAKNDLLDIETYNQAHNVKINNQNIRYQIPTPLEKCDNHTQANIDIFVFETDDQLAKFVAQNKNLYKTEQFLQPTNHRDMLFNLVYGLPAFYKAGIIQDQTLPAWQSQRRSIEITGVDELKFINDHTHTNSAIRVIKGSEDVTPRANSKQFFAYSLAKKSQEVVSTSTLYSSDKHISKVNGLIQPSDLIATSIGQYLNCKAIAKQTILGVNLYNKKDDVGVNYSQGVVIAYKKDRITLIDSDGNFRNISAAEGFSIEQGLDIPFLVQSIKKLKTFSE